MEDINNRKDLIRVLLAISDCMLEIQKDESVTRKILYGNLLQLAVLTKFSTDSGLDIVGKPVKSANDILEETKNYINSSSLLHEKFVNLTKLTQELIEKYSGTAQ